MTRNPTWTGRGWREEGATELASEERGSGRTRLLGGGSAHALISPGLPQNRSEGARRHCRLARGASVCV